MSRLFRNPGLLLLSLLCIPALAATFVGPSISIETGQNTIALRAGFDRQGTILESTRGVLMQSLAQFADSKGRRVGIQDVTLGTLSDGKTPCLRIGQEPCARFLLSTSQLRAIAQFVVHERVQAFTLPDDGPNPDRIVNNIKEIMVNVDGGDWIARELAGDAGLLKIFRYIDYDDPYDFTSDTFERVTAEKWRKEANAELGYSKQPETDIEDLTYVNADYNANFVAYNADEDVACRGLPARYDWELHEGGRHAYITDLQFAAPRFANTEHQQFYMEAQSLFCTTAILRSLHKSNPTAISVLLDK